MSGRYRFEAPSIGTIFEVDRLRRERHELVGQLTVRCNIPGARTVDGLLCFGDFTFTSLEARKKRASYLQDRARTNGDVDWLGELDSLAYKVIAVEEQGQPAIDLRELPRPERDDDIKVEGLTFPRRHPSTLFGDGGAAKSLTGLFAAAMTNKSPDDPLGEWESMKKRCGAMNRQKQPCRRGPVSGNLRCRNHGGLSVTIHGFWSHAWRGFQKRRKAELLQSWPGACIRVVPAEGFRDQTRPECVSGPKPLSRNDDSRTYRSELEVL